MTHTFVFVYGTLRQGGTREMRRSVPGAVFVSKAALRGELYDLGAYPGLQLSANGNLISGEVYQVTDRILQELDEIEGFHEGDLEASYYFRKQIAALLDGGPQHLCWVYECNPTKFKLTDPIPSGDWIEYAKSKTDWPEDQWPDKDQG